MIVFSKKIYLKGILQIVAETSLFLTLIVTCSSIIAMSFGTIAIAIPVSEPGDPDSETKSSKVRVINHNKSIEFNNIIRFIMRVL